MSDDRSRTLPSHQLSVLTIALFPVHSALRHNRIVKCGNAPAVRLTGNHHAEQSPMDTGEGSARALHFAFGMGEDQIRREHPGLRDLVAVHAATVNRIQNPLMALAN